MALNPGYEWLVFNVTGVWFETVPQSFLDIASPAKKKKKKIFESGCKDDIHKRPCIQPDIL